LYGLLNEAEWNVLEFVQPMQPANYANSLKERLVGVDLTVVSLSRFFSKHRIYLEPSICDKMQAIVQLLRMTIIKFDVSHMSTAGQPDMEMWMDAWKAIEAKFPPLRAELETQFRQLLSSKSQSELVDI
jgi:hypothetical protein